MNSDRDDNDDDDERDGNSNKDCNEGCNDIDCRGIFDLTPDENAVDNDHRLCSQLNEPKCDDDPSTILDILEQRCSAMDAISSSDCNNDDNDMCNVSSSDNDDDCPSQRLNCQDRESSTVASSDSSDSDLNCKNTINDQADEWQYATVNLCNLMQIKHDLNYTLTKSVARVRSINAEIERLQDKLVQLLAEETKQETQCEDLQRLRDGKRDNNVKCRSMQRQEETMGVDCNASDENMSSSAHPRGTPGICPKYTRRKPIHQMAERNDNVCSQLNSSPNSGNGISCKRKRAESRCCTRKKASKCNGGCNMDSSNYCPSQIR